MGGLYNFLENVIFYYHLMAVNMDKKPGEHVFALDMNQYLCATVRFLACLTNPS